MTLVNLLRGGVLLAVIAGAMALATPAFAQGIENSVHDLNVYNTNAITMPDSRICVACHTPHNGDQGVTDAPLWNHTLTVGPFDPYPSGGTIQATDLGDPGGISLLCLSCHDGSIALDAFGVGTSTVGNAAVTLSGNALVSTDLRNDHPISFTYNDTLAGNDQELHTPSDTNSGLGGFIADDMLFGTGNDQLECASCHDVHNGTALAALLRKTNDSSQLCLTCHDK
jgi:predicted CXXCH cytochrome family protein